MRDRLNAHIVSNLLGKSIGKQLCIFSFLFLIFRIFIIQSTLIETKENEKAECIFINKQEINNCLRNLKRNR